MPQKRQLKRQLYTLKKTEQGYAAVAPIRRGLVLSGGGAKGIAYLGMINAMHEQGFIQQLTHISGASAGALTAAILAIGVSNENITKLSDGLEIKHLLDTEGFRIRGQGERLRNLFEIIYMQQIREHLAEVKKPESDSERVDYQVITLKLNQYKEALSLVGLKITSMDDIVAIMKSPPSLQKLDRAFATIPKTHTNMKGEEIENQRITFTDLTRLRNLLPPEKKHLIKRLSVVTTNQTLKTLEIYSEKEHADESIAEKVQHSSAHPILFTPPQNKKGEYVADGGILDNMPTKAMKKEGLHREEILCVKVEAAQKFEKRIERAKDHSPEVISQFAGYADDFLECLIGGRLFTARTKTLNREKIFHDLGNMLYLDTGIITTTMVSPTAEQKRIVIAKAYQQTHELLAQGKVFENPLIAMLFLGVDKLDETLLENDNEHLAAAMYAKKIFLLQKTIADSINKKNYYGIEYDILQIEEVIKKDSQLTLLQQQQAMALCLKQIDFYTKGELKNYLTISAAQEKNESKRSWFKQLLALLWKPIEWVFALFTNPTPTNNATNAQITTSSRETENTALRILSLFNVEITEKSLEKSNSPPPFSPE